MIFNKNAFLLFFVLFLASILPSVARKSQFYSKSQFENKINSDLVNYVNSHDFSILTGHFAKDSTFIDSIRIYSDRRIIHIYFDARFSYIPFRENIVDTLERKISSAFGDKFQNFEINFYSDGKNIIEYIPNYYKSDSIKWDSLRTFGKLERNTVPLVRNISKPRSLTTNLENINIALWSSHGWYYEPKLNRWEWQRARLFGTVEDLLPTTYVLNYLLPMLENAGAQVYIPRERSWQTHEVIVDNDASNFNSIFTTKLNYSWIDSGFAIGNPPYTIENPFRQGTAIQFQARKHGKRSVEWIPDIPESGDYPVYISYKTTNQSSDSAHYLVYHTGGITEFYVNQQIGGSTWVYLGTFKFEKGVNTELGKVELLNLGNPNQYITADAVRFGGGMGNINRNGLASNRARYQEGARYYLQYAGFPDTLVWKLNANNDYADDRHARGAWVNFLMHPNHPVEGDTLPSGMGIPIDLSLALHTDAGVVGGDSVIGTLGIYNAKEDSAFFPNGLSKMTSRDMADIIQTQVVNDIRTKYDNNWVRRDLWDRGYNEAVRPKTPTMMLELLSHQNFMDVRFGKEPAFQFDVSRAIYKGILKFLNGFYGIPYIVQPLPVTHFQIQLTINGKFELKWQQQLDTLEPTASPDAYMVYTRINDGGYDNGMVVYTNQIIISPSQKDALYSFKITALNKGGESFPSEELSVCEATNSKGLVLIINAFDRLGGPAWYNDSTTAGFLDNIDQGVPYMFDFYTTGAQFDFNKNSLWLDDDSPGFGASFADMEDKIVPGNTFNFSYLHGQSIKKAGFSFVSASDEAVSSGVLEISNNTIIDFLAGEEKTIYLPKNDSVAHYQLFTKEMVSILKKHANSGGNIFISGAHIGTDAHLNNQDAEIASLLKYKWVTSNASKKGNFYFMNPDFSATDTIFQFNTGYCPSIYTVEGADALIPIDSTCTTLLRYAENNMSGGTIYNGKYKVVALGFPFETLIKMEERDLIMNKILTFFRK